MDLFDAIIDELLIISTWEDRDSSSGAYQLVCSIKQPEFILTIHILAKVFSISLPLSQLLQTQIIDLVEAMSLADNVLSIINNLRHNSDEEFKKIFEEVEIKCLTLDIEILLPRLVNMQKNRCNVKTTSPVDYYRISMYTSFLENFIKQLNDRFIAHKTLLANFYCILPNNKSVGNGEEHIKSLAEIYSVNLQCSPNQ